MLKGLSDFQNLINYHNNLHVSDIWPRSTEAVTQMSAMQTTS